MSSTSLAVLEASRSDLSELGCEQSPSAKSVGTASKSSSFDGPTYPSSEMSAESATTASDALGSTQMSLLPASPAKTSASGTPPEKASVDRGLDSGGNAPELLAKFDPSSYCWKTSQHCLQGDLETFSEIWPRSGMTRSGIAYRLPTLAPLIDATGCGLWPTPAARDGKDLARSKGYLSARSRHSPSMVTRLLERGTHWTRVTELVEKAMGYPSGWSVNGYTLSEILSFRKSQKPSGEQL